MKIKEKVLNLIINPLELILIKFNHFYQHNYILYIIFQISIPLNINYSFLVPNTNDIYLLIDISENYRAK